MALQQLVVQIQGLSGNDGDLDNLLQTLKTPQTDAVLRQNTNAILEALQGLDYATHSLGCSFLLEARAKASNTVQGDRDLFQAASSFLTSCNPEQIRLAPYKFTSVCRTFKLHAKALNKIKHAILPLTTAISKLCPSPSLLSPIHADLFELCLISKCYTAALPVLHTDVTSVDPNKSACTATDVLLYCYYGGMIATGLKDYARALDLYIAAITAPTMVLNAITVAALKKFMLVSLIHVGEIGALPKHTSQVVQRSLKSECGSYTDLAKLAGSKKSTAQDLVNYVSKLDVFQVDGNVGLVNLVIAAATQRKIQRLTETYVTLSLEEVASQVGLDQGPSHAELALLRMVDTGLISAKISGKADMVEFSSDLDSLENQLIVDRIDALITRTHELAKEMDQISYEVESDRAFINKTELKMHHHGGKGGRIDLDMPMLEDAVEGSFRESFQPSQ